MIGDRDAATTRWRMDDDPRRRRYRRFYLVRSQRTLGYVVLGPRIRWGEDILAVRDYLAPRRWVAPLLTAAAHFARREGVFALVCRTLNEGADRALRAAGFLRRGHDVEAPLRLVLHSCLADDEVTARLTEAGHWFLTDADSDLTM